jgi:nucleotide-binding universal stress UspA family protein
MSDNATQSGISNILIATDGSVYADAAMECGAWLASHTSANVTALYIIDARRLAGHFIVHVPEIIGSRPDESLAGRVRDYYRSQGEQALGRAKTICERRGVKCHTQLETGNVTTVLVDASAGVDLLVMGIRGEDEEYETGFPGSVTEKVVRKVQRPMLLTHLLFKEFRRALLAYDGSDAARKAMEMLARLAVTLKMDVDAAQLVEEGEDTTVLREVLLYFQQFHVPVSIHYLVGDSHSLIIDHAKENNCDLLAMGAYDNRLADTLALGTTTEYLMRNSPVPVLVHH